MIRPEVMKAIGGGGLTAQDYAGLTPEQIQAVAGHGQQDRQMMLGTVQNMQQNEMQERKQNFDEMHQDRTFKLMENQEVRARYQMMIDAGFKTAGLRLQQQGLALERQRTNSAILTDEKQRSKLDYELAQLKRNQDLITKLDTTLIETPFGTGDQGKMSLGAIQMMGSDAANTIFKYHVAKNLQGSGIGGIGIPGIGGAGAGDASNPEVVRAIKMQMWADKGLDPKASAIMAEMDGLLITPFKYVESRSKVDTLFKNMPQDQQMAEAEKMVEMYNDSILKTYTGQNQGEWQRAAQQVKTRQEAAANTAGALGGGTAQVNPTKPSFNDVLQPPADSDIDGVEQLDSMLSASEQTALEKQYPSYFQYSEVYKKKVLKPNVALLLGKEVAERSIAFGKDAYKDINKWLEDLSRRDPAAQKSRAEYLKGVVNR